MCLNMPSSSKSPEMSGIRFKKEKGHTSSCRRRRRRVGKAGRREGERQRARMSKLRGVCPLDTAAVLYDSI